MAAVPLLTVLVLLGVFRWKAQWAGLAALVVSLLVAVFAYDMPVGMTFDAAGYGVANSVLTVLWITFNAWIYNLTVETGHFAVLRRSFAAISDDKRVQAVVIAFSFGALMEALAGGGSPIAICSVMLIAAGFQPLKADVIALLAARGPGSQVWWTDAGHRPGPSPEKISWRTSRRPVGRGTAAGSRCRASSVATRHG